MYALKRLKSERRITLDSASVRMKHRSALLWFPSRRVWWPLMRVARSEALRRDSEIGWDQLSYSTEVEDFAPTVLSERCSKEL
jgi:hypothetical protein